MTYAQMTALLPDKDSPAESAGRGFFSTDTLNSDRKAVLEFLLKERRYEQLCKLIYCGHINGGINMKNNGVDYMSVTGENSTLNMRYFSLFLQTAVDCDLEEEKYIPLVFAAATAEKRSVLRVWKQSSEKYLSMLAGADYDRAWAYLCKNDPDFRLVSILFDTHRERAVDDLIKIAIFGKGINKVALRNVLRGCKSEVFSFIRPIYATLKTEARITSARLLLLFKNDPEVAEFLSEILRVEKSKSVQKLLHSDLSYKPGISEKIGKKQIVNFFYDAMVRGVSVSRETFLNVWIAPPYDEVSDSLFFGIYKDNALQFIVIIDGGKVFDLNNAPIEVPEDCSVKVLHPVELTAKTEFLTRLNITQPFEQIKRKIYVPTSEDNRSNSCRGIAGTVLNIVDFKAGMKKIGFRALNRDGDGICGQVGLRRDGILCVLHFAPIDFESSDVSLTVQAQCVKFYFEKDVIKLGGKMFVDGVTPLSVAHLDARIFSEFMYSVYELMGCR